MDTKPSIKNFLIVILPALLTIFVIFFLVMPQVRENRVKDNNNTEAKACMVDSDCVVFGKDGDCNCGCFNKNHNWEAEGECFCAAPESCACEAGKCEVVFEDKKAITEDTKKEACERSGGIVSVSLCCESAEDFPNLCLIGPCGCSPDNSREINICDCGEGKCFNGKECVVPE